MRRQNTTITLSLLLAVCLSNWLHAATVAVIDVGDDVAVPGQFIDLLTLNLSKAPGTIVVERGDIDLVIAEQVLSLLHQGPSGDSEIKAGRLLACDALLLLEANAGDKSLVRARLVDTRYGLRLHDFDFHLVPAASPWSGKVEWLTGLTVRRLAKVTDPEQMVLAAIGRFRSEDVTPRWDLLGQELSDGISRQLAAAPRILVLERQKTAPLVKERQLAAGLPEALQSSTAMISGSYRVVRGGENDVIEVKVSCRREGMPAFEQQLSGPLTEINDICRRATEALAKALTREVGVAADRLAESALLLTECQLLERSRNPRDALAAIDAAVALAPESNEALMWQWMVLETCFWQLSNNGPDRRQTGEPVLTWYNGLARLCVRRVAVTEKLLAQAEDPRYPDARKLLTIHSVFMNLGSLDQIQANRQNVFADAGVPRSAELLPRYWTVMDRAMSHNVGHPNAYVSLLAVAGNRLETLTDTADAIRRSAWLAERTLVYLESAEKIKPTPRRGNSLDGPQATMFNPYAMLVHLLDFPSSCKWAKEAGAADAVERYLVKQLQVEDVRLRAAALLALSYFYSSDRELKLRMDGSKAKAYWEAFFSVVVNKVWPANPYLKTELARHFYHDLTPGKGVNLQPLRVVEAAIAQGRLKERWWVLEAAFRVSHDYAQQDNFAKAVEVVEKPLTMLPADDPKLQHFYHGLRYLKRQLNTSAPPLSVETLLTLDDPWLTDALGGWGPDPKFRTMHVDGDTVYILVHATPGTRNQSLRQTKKHRWPASYLYNNEATQRVGILRFDLKTGRPQQFVKLPVDMPTPKPRTNELLRFYSDYSPYFAVAGDVIAVGFPGEGIVIRDADGTCRVLNEGNGLVSAAMLSLCHWRGKLYSVLGDSRTDSGLMEVDLASGRSRLIASSRSETPRHALDGRMLGGVAIDRKRDSLLVYGRGIPGDPTQLPKLYHYAVKTGRVTVVPDSTGSLFSHLSRLIDFGDHVVGNDFFESFRYDKSSGKLRKLLKVEKVADAGPTAKHIVTIGEHTLYDFNTAEIILRTPGQPLVNLRLTTFKDLDGWFEDMAPVPGGALLMTGTALMRLQVD